jgi:hypothetical protein
MLPCGPSAVRDGAAGRSLASASPEGEAFWAWGKVGVVPQITEVHWALWYGLIYFIAIVGAWMVVTLIWIFVGLHRRPRVQPFDQPKPSKTELPDLANDPELHRFFARVNHAYRRQPPRHAEAPLPGTAPLSRPRLLSERGDPVLIAEAPIAEPYSVKDDPFVLHSAPFYSPREEQPATPRSAPKPIEPPTTQPAASPPPPPSATPRPTEQDLIAMVNLWAQLSEKDRRELLALARIKASLEK